MPERPQRSIIIWFTQRVGSTLLAQSFEDTGVAGRPREWFNHDDATSLLEAFGAADAAGLRDALWERGSTANGVLGLKCGSALGRYEAWTSLFKGLLGSGVDEREAWEAMFPACRHVFITRRDTLRQAVSWWRAIQSGGWHKPLSNDTAVGAHRLPPSPEGLLERYDADAIQHLFIEARQREMHLQEIFERQGVVPHTVVYEDLIASYEPTVRRALAHLDLPGDVPAEVPPPAFARVADEVSESWYQQFKRERLNKT